MEDLTFLEHFGRECGDNNGILKAVDLEGRVCHISDCISPFRLLDQCPLLYHAFEYGAQNRLQANIEAPSRAAVVSLLRYCYTGSYLPPGFEYVPIRLLLHAQVYKMAEDFDIPELQLLAHGNFSVQVDCACCLPMPPQDLSETIRFVYAHFATPQARQQQGLIHTLLNYCVSVFQYHKLGESAQFLEVVRQVPDFRQDLCRINMEREFQDECAFDIIGLAIDPLHSQPENRPTTLASRDLPSEMLYDRPNTPCAPPLDLAQAIKNAFKRDYDSDEDDVHEDTAQPSSTEANQSTLAYRPKPSSITSGFETDSASEDEGFSLVHHAKPPASSGPDDLMSSPDIVPFKAADILAATGSYYPDDDEWTML